MDNLNACHNSEWRDKKVRQIRRRGARRRKKCKLVDRKRRMPTRGVK